MTTGPATRHLGLDLGATNLKWAVVEHADGTWSTLAHGQVPTRLVADPEAVPASVTSQLAEMAATVIAEWGPVESIRVGVPGLYDPATGRIRFLPNVPGPWAGHPVGEAVAAAASVPVALINDARAFGLAELRLGAGRGASSMVGLTLGTGVGGVIAVGGRVHQGHDGTGGELGHQTIDPDGPWCGCGNRGCVEAYARADQLSAACGTATPEEAVIAAARSRKVKLQVGHIERFNPAMAALFRAIDAPRFVEMLKRLNAISGGSSSRRRRKDRATST